MATKRPSFLKRQKEQKRATRAAEKREVRRHRKDSKSDNSGEFAGTDLATEDADGEISPAGNF